MSLNIDHILKLSNIKMSEAEIELLEKQLKNIVNWLDIIAKVDTTGVEPMYNRLQDLQIINIQDKKVEENIGAERILRNAPEVFESFFVVPRIIDNS